MESSPKHTVSKEKDLRPYVDQQSQKDTLLTLKPSPVFRGFRLQHLFLYLSLHQRENGDSSKTEGIQTPFHGRNHHERACVGPRVCSTKNSRHISLFLASVCVNGRLLGGGNHLRRLSTAFRRNYRRGNHGIRCRTA